MESPVEQTRRNALKLKLSDKIAVIRLSDATNNDTVLIQRTFNISETEIYRILEKRDSIYERFYRKSLTKQVSSETHPAGQQPCKYQELFFELVLRTFDALRHVRLQTTNITSEQKAKITAKLDRIREKVLKTDRHAQRDRNDLLLGLNIHWKLGQIVAFNETAKILYEGLCDS